MKKPILIIIILLILAFISVYFIVPQKIKTNHVIEIDATDINAAKFLINKKPWGKWWPGRHNAADSNLYSYNGVNYLLQESTNGGITVLIKQGDIELNSKITYSTTGEGMCEVSWATEMQSSLNPFERVAEFIKIKRLTKGIDTLLITFKKFMV
jgi:hypothetical protein